MRQAISKEKQKWVRISDKMNVESVKSVLGEFSSGRSIRLLGEFSSGRSIRLLGEFSSGRSIRLLGEFSSGRSIRLNKGSQYLEGPFHQPPAPPRSRDPSSGSDYTYAQFQF